MPVNFFLKIPIPLFIFVLISFVLFIKKKAKDIILFHSDNDPYVPLSHGKKLKVNLDAKLVVLPGQFHFSVSSGGDRFKELPELLRYI